MPPGSADEVILVVEDDDDVRRTHVGMLKEMNYGILRPRRAVRQWTCSRAAVTSPCFSPM